MKKRSRMILLAVLVGIFLLGSSMMLRQLWDYHQGTREQARAESLAGLPNLSDVRLPESIFSPGSTSSEETPGENDKPYVDPYADALRTMDFAALQAVNPDVLGWILIPDTVVSYPFLRGEDNDYYLRRTWRKGSSALGSIFLETKNHADLSDFNTVIYGHNMNNGSMFGSLKKYQNQDYFQSHPYIYLTTENGSARYEIFAAYEVSTDGESYRLSFADDRERQTFLDACCALSVIETGVTPQICDHVITLSTCTGRGHATRWVVQARLPGEVPEGSPEDLAKAPAETIPTADGGSPVVEETIP